MPDDRERCLDAGATAYLSKPLKLAELVSTVQRLLEA
jgi:CheY-like chemotaxis protein